MSEASSADKGDVFCTVLTYDKKASEVTLFEEELTVTRVKLKIAEVLNLKPASMELFSLFTGTRETPRKLLDTGELLASGQVVCLLRTSLYKDNEINLLSDDENALRLIFWEAAETYRRGKIIPKVDSGTSSQLEKLLIRCSAILPPSVPLMASFMSLIYSIPYYFWSLYHRADFCVLQHPATIAGEDMPEGTELQVAVNAEELLILDVSGDREIASWFWDEVHQLRLHEKKSQDQLMFEVINEDRKLKKDVFQSFIIASYQSQYIYSLAVFILKILDKRYIAQKSALEEDYKELLNPGFRKKISRPGKPRSEMHFTGKCNVDTFASCST